MYIDLLIKIKNAQRAGKKSLKSRSSRRDKDIADMLSRHGFVGAVEVKGRPGKRFLIVGLQGKRAIEGAKFLSKPSVREYAGYRELGRVKGGRGLLVLSTPKGIIDGVTAKREKVGGELLFEVW
ncbi:MAG: 30S ribosomal protein S8 [Patescibacteria group bacterium]